METNEQNGKWIYSVATIKKRHWFKSDNCTVWICKAVRLIERTCFNYYEWDKKR